MPMWHIGRLIILIFIYTYIFSGCKKPENNINSLIKGSNTPISFIDTLTVISHTVKEDSLKGVNLPTYQIGYLVDPNFGISISSIYTQILLPYNEVSFGNEPQIDSAILSLRVTGSYGINDDKITFIIQQITEDMDPDADYYSDQLFSHNTEIIGSERINKSATGDTIINIKLTKKFAEEMLQQSGSANLANNDAFLSYFKGLFISVDTTDFYNINVPDIYKTNNGIASEGNPFGYMLYLDLIHTNSKLTFYYHTSDLDSQTFSFEITADAAIINNYRHNHSNYPVESFINSNAASGDSLVFIESASGLKSFIEIPYIKSLGNILLNKAEIVFTQPVECAKNTIAFNSPNEMILIRRAEDGSNDFSIIDLTEATGYFGGNRNLLTDLSGNNYAQYKFNITRYLQSVINNETTDYGLYLLTSPSAIIADRIIIGGGNAINNKIKLNITYTKIGTAN